ncbi:hypothetical protein FACS1894141_4100 [Spirochaetia bacterium]|nr:hypothetical protein FACS1894141_4100 [Spirochaetia bacterium]
MIYILFLIPFMAFSIAEVAGMQAINRKAILIGLTTILILFVGLRYHTGADWHGYINMFNNYHQEGMNREIGYMFLNRVFKRLIDNYYVLQFAVTCFVCISFYKFIAKYSKYPIVSLFLFIIFFMYNILMAQVRQSIAIAIILFSTQYIFDRKALKFLMMIALACLFHISAIVAISLYFFNKNWGKIIPVILVSISLIFYYKYDIVLLAVSIVAPFLPERLSLLAIHYLEIARQGNFGIAFIGTTALNLFLIIFFKPKNDKNCFFFNIIVVSSIIASASKGMDALDRLQSYYLVYATISYTYLFMLFDFKKIRELFFLYLCCILLFFAIPFERIRLNHFVSELSKRDVQYQWVPYYNVLYHPYNAQFRKDWTE